MIPKVRKGFQPREEAKEYGPPVRGPWLQQAETLRRRLRARAIRTQNELSGK